MGGLARDVRALTRALVAVQSDIERYRDELREVFDRILDEYEAGDRPASTRRSVTDQ